MYDRGQPQERSRSRCGAKPQNAGLGLERPTSGSDLGPIGCDLMPIGRARGEGNVQFRNRTYAPKITLDSSCGSGLPIEEDSFALGFRRSSSTKASGAPIKTLIGEEMSEEVEIRRPSPGVIAKLMGLDTMPPRVVPKKQKEIGNFRKASAVGFKEKYVTYEDRSLWMNDNEHQEIIDVFEVVQSSKVEKQKRQKDRKGMSRSKQGEIDMTSIKQKFIDKKHLPNDETLQNSKGFNDALEVQDSNEDLLLKFLHGPNPLFTKHLHDLKCDPSSQHASHITILKSSKGTKRETSGVCLTSTRNAERCIHMQGDFLNSYRKPASCCYVPNKLSQSRHVGKVEADHHPTKIVLLKPSLEKGQNMPRTVHLAKSHENLEFGCRGHSEFPRSAIWELHSEGRDRQLSDNEMLMGNKTKSSRDIAREFTKQVRNTERRGTQEVLPSKFDGYSMDESTCNKSGMDNLDKYDAFLWDSDLDDCSNSFDATSCSSLGSSVNREARKRLAKRWKTIHHFQEMRLLGRRSSTLGEMLALSDKETIQEVSNSWKNSSSANLLWANPASSTLNSNPKPRSRNCVGGSNNCYMLKDIHNTGLNDSLNRNVSRHESSSLRSFRCRSNKHQFSSDGEEDKLPEREIHVLSEKLRNRIHVEYLVEKKAMIPMLSDDAIVDTSDIVDNVSMSEYEGLKFPSIINEELVKHPTTLTVLLKDGAFSSYDQKDILIKEISIEHPQKPLPSHCNISESGSSLSSDEADRPSPVSILEAPSKVEKLRCFERVTTDIQDLRMQLQLLKLESAAKFAEELEVFDPSDEESGGDPHFQILQEFRDEEDRDFSYLLDMVIESGIYGSDWNTLFVARHSQVYPVHAYVFDKLEKKYSLLVSWPRTERKLLFDLINASLVDIIVPCMDPRPSVKSTRGFGSMRVREDLVEEAWQMVVRQKKEVSGNPEDKLLDPRWLDVGNDVCLIGREIERMVKEDLLEELLSELV